VFAKTLNLGGLPLANRSRQTFIKRQKERARQEKQRVKSERRVQRNTDKVKTESIGGEDPDIAGMVTGPQAQEWLSDVLTDAEIVAIEEAEEAAKKKAEKESAGA
jgi:hypothetical protein